MFVRRNAGPLGLGVAAFIAFVAGGAQGRGGLIFLALVLGAAAGLLAVRQSGRPEPEPLSTVPVSDEVRRRKLQETLSRGLASGEGRIESSTPYSAVVVFGRPVNHVLHLLASVFLCGLWIPVWILIAVSGGEKRLGLTVDECGNVIRRESAR